jgi:hypothetical protein
MEQRLNAGSVWLKMNLETRKNHGSTQEADLQESQGNAPLTPRHQGECSGDGLPILW